jgi:hypothetical protein
MAPPPGGAYKAVDLRDAQYQIDEVIENGLQLVGTVYDRNIARCYRRLKESLGRMMAAGNPSRRCPSNPNFVA